MGCFGQHPRAYYGQFKQLPHGNGEFKWLYTIGFNDGVTKIGCTYSPRQRITAHAYAKASSALIEWFHVGRCVAAAEAANAERAALNAALSVATGPRTAREWFRGLAKADAIRCVGGSLDQPTPTQSTEGGC